MDSIVLIDENNTELNAKVIRYFKYQRNFYLIFSFDEIDEKDYQKLYLVQILEELGEKISRNITDDEEWKEMQEMVKDSIKQIKGGNDNNIEKLNSNELNGLKINSPRFFKLNKKLVDLLETDIVDDIEIGDEIMEAFNDEKELVKKETPNVIQQENIPMEPINDDVPLQTIEPINDSIQDIQKTIEQPQMIVPMNSIENEELNSIQNEIKPIEIENTEVDYKELYFLVKADKEATEQLLDSLMDELLKYKKKYGELTES